MEMIEDLGYEYPNKNSKQKAKYGVYMCPVCNKSYRTQQRYVINGRSTMCNDCGRAKSKNKTHGLESHELYGRWQAMKQRCINPNNRDYPNYGAKGVTVCAEWLNDFESYYNWCISNGYSSELFLDKDIKSAELGISPAVYSPATCTFVTMKRNSQEVSGVKVIQKDMEGNFIAEFNSYQDAARAVYKNIRKQISKCCNSELNSIGGFKWEKK